MSPESIDLKYSPKSDIWAFGILAYKFYFNRLPFEGKDSIQIFKKVKISDLSLHKEIEPDIEELFRLTLCKEPEKRPTAAELKKIKFFEQVNFKYIFNEEAPISKEELTMENQEAREEKPGVFLFEKVLEKKMFFGNYKPRCLTISKSGDRLVMAYRYVPTRKVKNQFQLNLNDYAAVIKENEFEVVTTDKRYQFRLQKNESSAQVVEQINNLIRKGYSLE